MLACVSIIPLLVEKKNYECSTHIFLKIYLSIKSKGWLNNFTFLFVIADT